MPPDPGVEVGLFFFGGGVGWGVCHMTWESEKVKYNPINEW